MSVDEKLRSLLLPVFGLEKPEDIKPEDTLVGDLGAESLDFVEIIFLIEKEFGVHLETKEIVSGGISEDNVFIEGKLTDEGVKLIRERLPEQPNRFTTGMSKMDIFQKITVGDLTHIINIKTGK